MKRYILLNPGPVNTSEKVRRAQMQGDLCHREIEFTQMLQRIRKNLLKVFRIERDFYSVVLSGSGTASLEAALISCLDANQKTLVIDNGVYGERIAEILWRYRYKHLVLKFPWGDSPDLKHIEGILKKDSRIKAIAMVHHETSSGLLNPLDEIGRLARRYRKMLLVDGISSLGGEDLNFKNVDVCVGSANKCIQGLPGTAFVLLRKSLVARMRTFPKKSLYFDLCSLLMAEEKGETPFTPAIPAFYSFDVALEELLQEGLRNRIKRYGQYSSYIRKEMKKLGLRSLVADAGKRSRVLTAYCLPKGWTYQRLHDALKKEGFVIYAGQGSLKKKIFRVANIGALKKSDLRRLMRVFKKIGISQ